MHIADGTLPLVPCLAAHAAALVLVWAAGRRVTAPEIPRMGMLSAAAFASSAISFPLAGTSVHLGFYGLLGVLLGPRSCLVVYASLVFQAILFHHGGLLSLGVNAMNMSAGAMAAALCWRVLPAGPRLRSFTAGFMGTLLPAVLMALEFEAAGYGRGFFVVAGIYCATAAVEGSVTAAVIALLERVTPRYLQPA